MNNISDSVSLEYLVNSSSENTYVDMIDRKSFYENIRKYDIELEEIFNKNNITEINKEKFNALLKKLKKTCNINIFESILFLEQDFADMNGLVSLLSDDLKYELKEELSSKYHIKLLKNKLAAFFGEIT